jgi:hypothetical protein
MPPEPPPGGAVLGGGDVIAAERKEVVDLIMGRKKPLRLAGGFEPLHLPLAIMRWPVADRGANTETGQHFFAAPLSSESLIPTPA